MERFFKMNRPNLDQATVRRLFRYDPITGNLIWRWRDDVPKDWNTKYAGKVAGSIWRPRNRKTSYRRVGILGWKFFAHRVIWLYMTGKWLAEIDHADQDGLNNRWANLREATQAQNKANSGANRNNKLGIRGVRFRKQCGRFTAQIGVEGKQRYLGLFDTEEEARAAYLIAATEVYGEFARVAS
jgi:hypothetical protein